MSAVTQPVLRPLVDELTSAGRAIAPLRRIESHHVAV
jgi:hypothetical protein